MPPAGAHGLRPFCVAAVNVNGLAAAAKRRLFFAWLQQQAPDVVLLAETHSRSDQQMQQWAQQGAGQGRPWQGYCYAHSKPLEAGVQASAGVAVLLSQKLVKQDTEPVIEFADGQGRLLRVAWTTPWGQQMAAVAVYAPDDHTARPAWFQGPYQEALEEGALGSSLIVGGDFNCALQEIDVQPVAGTRARHSRRMVGAAQLQRVTVRTGLVDAWRHHNPHTRQPTHYSYHGSAAGNSNAAAATTAATAATGATHSVASAAAEQQQTLQLQQELLQLPLQQQQAVGEHMGSQQQQIKPRQPAGLITSSCQRTWLRRAGYRKPHST